jgi:hypothetical protein
MDAVDELETGAVAQNTSKIAEVEGKLNTTSQNVSNITNRLSALETEIGTDTNSRIDALEGVTAKHTEDIGANTNAISKIKLETLPALQTAIDEEVATREDKIKEVTDAIDALEQAHGTDLEGVRKLITDETTRADTEEKRIVGLIEAEAARADKAEKVNATAIAEIDATLKAALENDGAGLDSIKELAVWITQHETEVLPIIEKNSKDIAALIDKVDTGDKTVATYVDDAIAAIPTAASGVKGLVKPSPEVTVTAEGTLGLGEVSTDKLVQGTLTLVLDGGDAEVPASN